MGRKTTGRHMEMVNQEQLSQRKKLESVSDKKAAILDATDADWMQITDRPSSSSTSAGDHHRPIKILASDPMMMKAQQAFEAVNNSHNQLRETAMKLRGKIDPSIVTGGLEQVKIAQSALDELEEMLVRTPREHLYEDEVKKRLVSIATRYQGIRLKELELKALEKNFCTEESFEALKNS